MLKTLIQIGLGSALILWAPTAFAGSTTWAKASTTKVQTQGLKIADGESCETLEAQWSDRAFHLKVRCGTYFFSSLYPLNSKKSALRVARTKSTLVITGFDYKSYKIQTQNDTFHSLRIPYVKEVLRVEKFADGGLSVYRETFKNDDLGRIVSTASMQIVSLEGKSSSTKAKSRKFGVASVSRSGRRAKIALKN